MKRKSLLTIGIIMCVFSLCACGKNDSGERKKANRDKRVENKFGNETEMTGSTIDLPEVSLDDGLEDNDELQELAKQYSEDLMNYAALKMVYPEKYGDIENLNDETMTTIIGYSFNCEKMTPSELNQYAEKYFDKTIDINSLEENEEFYIDADGNVCFYVGDWGMSYPEIVSTNLFCDDSKMYVTNSVLMYDSEADEYVGDAKDYTITYVVDSSAGKLSIEQFEISEDSIYSYNYEESTGSEKYGYLTLFDDFIDGKIPATYIDSDEEFYITDLNMNSDEWDSYSVGQRVDLDNDGEYELIINGPYGGMYLDACDGKIKVFAEGEGEALTLSYAYYEGKYYVVKSDTIHAGRQTHSFTEYSGADVIVDTFDLTAEYDGKDSYDKNSKFTFRGKKISMDEYEEKCNMFF